MWGSEGCIGAIVRGRQAPEFPCLPLPIGFESHQPPQAFLKKSAHLGARFCFLGFTSPNSAGQPYLASSGACGPHRRAGARAHRRAGIPRAADASGRALRHDVRTSSPPLPLTRPVLSRHLARADGSGAQVSQGLITLTRAARYGATSRVATIKARELAVAAMQPSAMPMALPSRRARAIRLA